MPILKRVVSMLDKMTLELDKIKMLDTVTMLLLISFQISRESNLCWNGNRNLYTLLYITVRLLRMGIFISKIRNSKRYKKLKTQTIKVKTKKGLYLYKKRYKAMKYKKKE